MTCKDSNHSWRIFKTPQHNACPVELGAQFEIFKDLMVTQPTQGTASPNSPDVSAVGSPDVEC